LAKKTNESSDQIDLTMYGYAKSCGVCHPGGGAMEIDRDGNRYDNAQTWKSPESLDGDYHGNKWLESGSMEADCLICHMDSYDIFARNEQIQGEKFRAAPSVGAGLATVISNNEVAYLSSIFEADGKVALEGLNKRATDDNCSSCHAGTPGKLWAAPGKIRSDIAKRGRSWNDPQNPDVHNSANIQCVDCHSMIEDPVKGITKLTHQIAKGHDTINTARDDLDNSMQKCGQCHEAGNTQGAPVPNHGALNDHLAYIDCSTCHIPQKQFFAIRYKDFSAGPAKGYPIGRTKTDLHVGFKPIYTWWDVDGNGAMKIVPVNFLSVGFWNDGEAPNYPVFIGKIKQAAQAAGLTDDIGDDGVLDVNTPQEIDAMRTQLMGLGVQDPKMYVSVHSFLMSHNVAPSEQALGSGGCADCHSTGSHMFEGDALVHNFPLGPSDHVVRHVPVKMKDGQSAELHVGQKTAMWNVLGYDEARKNALMNLNQTQPSVGVQNRSVVVATVTDNGQPVSGVEVALARSVSGAALDYRWMGVTGADGRVEIEVTANSPQFIQKGVAGYYVARALLATTDAAVGKWHSIPLSGGKQISLSLPVGGKAQVVSEDALGAAKRPRLFANFPNPFNPSTEIRYDLYASTKVSLVVYNELGQQVRSLVQKRQSAGNYWVEWNGRDDAGREVASGVYFYRLDAGSAVQTRRLMMLK
jgi:hypothetical protein